MTGPTRVERARDQCRGRCGRPFLEVLFDIKWGRYGGGTLDPEGETAMKKSLRRIRGALGMGVTWAAGWALAGVLIGVTSRLLPGLPWDSFFEVFDAPLPALAIPGFIGGALFSTVLGIAGRRRRFDELSLPRFAAWGALGGLLLSLVPAAPAAVGFLTVGPGVDMWRVTAVMSG